MHGETKITTWRLSNVSANWIWLLLAHCHDCAARLVVKPEQPLLECELTFLGANWVVIPFVAEIVAVKVKS